MPKKWVPPGTFMRLEIDTTVYYAYKDGNANHVLLYVYNMSYYEEEEQQFDVRDLIPKLEKAGLNVADEKKLQLCIEQSKHDNGTRDWHRGLIRLAWRHKMLPRENA